MNFEEFKNTCSEKTGILLGCGPSLVASSKKVLEMQSDGAFVFGNNHSMFCMEKFGFELDYHTMADHRLFYEKDIFDNYVKYKPKKHKFLALHGGENVYKIIAQKYGSDEKEFQAKSKFIKVPNNRSLIFFDKDGVPNKGWSPMNLTSLESTIQIMLFAGFKQIFLAGVDCSREGNMFHIYGDGKKKDARNYYSHMSSVWGGFKIYKEKFWKEVKVISINPVGLKGLFEDIYT